MARQKSARRQQLEAMMLYPVDWLEERSGLVGGIRYFLFRKVPGDTNWFHTLGSATLTAFIVQTVTGVITLHLYLVIRLGVSSPPWSKDAAGADRPEPEPTARPGLTRPAPRGGIAR